MDPDLEEVDDGGIPEAECIIVGEGDTAIDLRRSRCYVKGNHEGLSVLQLSLEPGFAIHLDTNPKRIDVHFSMRLKQDMEIQEAVIEYGGNIVYRKSLKVNTGTTWFNKGDLLHVTLPIETELPIYVRK